jgi:hypothetical protein
MCFVRRMWRGNQALCFKLQSAESRRLTTVLTPSNMWFHRDQKLNKDICKLCCRISPRRFHDGKIWPWNESDDARWERGWILCFADTKGCRGWQYKGEERLPKYCKYACEQIVSE